MQLDQTRVVIRERGWLDILDLALGMFRTRAFPILVLLAVGSLPFALANHAIIHWLTDGFPLEDRALYVWYLLLLMLIEVPIATAPLTIYLGQLLFVDRPEPRTIRNNFLQSLPQLVLFQLLLRVCLIVPVVTWFVPYAIWPFLNEIILLERNPLRARRPGEISTRRRSSALHAGMSGDLFGRSCGALALGAILTIGLACSLRFARSLLGGTDESGWWLMVVELPLAMWLVAGFFTVVRFLSYLDLRIRREGWEVELSLRAEAARMTRQLV